MSPSHTGCLQAVKPGRRYSFLQQLARSSHTSRSERVTVRSVQTTPTPVKELHLGRIDAGLKELHESEIVFQ